MKASIKKSPMYRILIRYLKNSQINYIQIEDLRNLLQQELLDDFVPEFLAIQQNVRFCAANIAEDDEDDDDVSRKK